MQDESFLSYLVYMIRNMIVNDCVWAPMNLTGAHSHSKLFYHHNYPSHPSCETEEFEKKLC